MNIPIKASPPANSKALELIHGAYFYDAWKINAAVPELDPLEQYLYAVKSTPKWIETAMTLRNQVAEKFALKSLGAFSDIDHNKRSNEYLIGDSVGIFTLIDHNTKEVLLGDDDNHLNVIVSIHKHLEPATSQTIITVSTIVHVKNWLGRLYMIPVTLAHHIIAKRMIGAIGS